MNDKIRMIETQTEKRKRKPYNDLDLVERGPADRSARPVEVCGLGGRDPEKKGWANLARALAARWEYFWP